MDDSLQLMLNQFMASAPCLPSNHGDDISALRSRMTVTQFLSKLEEAELLPEHFVTFIYATFQSASVEWMLPTCGLENQEGPVANSTNDAADGTYERQYLQLFTTLSRHAHIRSLVNEEETCEDLRKKLGDKAGIACGVMLTFTNLLNNLSSQRNCTEQTHSRAVQRVITTLSCGALDICLEHEEQSYPWTTPQSVECGKNLLAALFAANNCDTIESLLTVKAGKFSLLQHVLHSLLPKLSRTTWKLNPAASHIFRRCLMMTRQPLLSDCLPMLLPPTLLFVDDFESANRLSGLHCLQHVMRHASKTELRWFGRADVIYDSLQRALFGCDHVALETIIVCLFDVLDVIEASPRRASSGRLWCRHDDIFAKYLSNMEMESKVLLRHVYAKNLANFVSKLGITVVRHLKQLLRVVADYLQVSDGPEELCRRYILQAVLAILTEAWPRIPPHADNIMKSLVRLLEDIRQPTHVMSSSARASLQHQTLESIRLLQNICPEYLELTEDFFSQIMGETVQPCMTT